MDSIKLQNYCEITRNYLNKPTQGESTMPDLLLSREALYSAATRGDDKGVIRELMKVLWDSGVPLLSNLSDQEKPKAREFLDKYVA